MILTSGRVFILLQTRSWWWSGPEVPLKWKKRKRIPLMPPVLPCGVRRLSHPVFVTWSKLGVSFLPKLKEVLAWSWHAVKIWIPNSTHSSLHGLQCELRENTLPLIQFVQRSKNEPSFACSFLSVGKSKYIVVQTACIPRLMLHFWGGSWFLTTVSISWTAQAVLLHDLKEWLTHNGASSNGAH